MTRKFSVFASGALLGICVLISSCSNSGGGGPAPAAAPPAPAAQVPAETPAASVPAVVLSRAALWTEKEGVMTPVTQATKGDTVIWKNEIKNAPRSSDKATREYARVEFDGKEYWIQSILAAADATPGVITGQETVRYTRASFTALHPQGLTIPQYLIVAVHSGRDADGFVGISAWIEGERALTINNEFVKKENVSTRPEDVKAMQLYTLAGDAKTEVSKRELLRNALAMGSRFNDLIEERLNSAGEAALAAEDVPPYEVPVIRPGATVYDTPTIRGRNVGLAPNDSFVTVTARTVQEEKLNSGDTARWYKIAEPEGWVFGSYLEGNGEGQ
ncbi:MAG: SH3 domain-containing protein [Spirochaetia bacterium]|jgi:hypothetical protein|nr:SH3 domain-containing protein [Spirochaetia bacterium]